MLDNKQRHGDAALSAFGAANPPTPRRGDDRAGACRGVAACGAARKFL